LRSLSVCEPKRESISGWSGGTELIASFLDAGAVDEFIVNNVIPHMVGGGIPLILPQHRDLPLKLLACQTFSDGVVQLDYAVESS
jgi:riboflavin biosynthesis pyrimidine reductase